MYFNAARCTRQVCVELLDLVKLLQPVLHLLYYLIELLHVLPLVQTGIHTEHNLTFLLIPVKRHTVARMLMEDVERSSKGILEPGLVTLVPSAAKSLVVQPYQAAFGPVFALIALLVTYLLG